jgi:hypothetical protein
VSLRRLVVIACTFLVAVAAAGWGIYVAGGAKARAVGNALYLHRSTTLRPLRARPARPPVVWLGDSTIMDVDQYPSYVPMVQAQVFAPVRLAEVRLEGPGLDFYAYWSLAGRIAALQPNVAVVIANLRNFGAEGGERGFNDLVAEIDLRDLPETLELPYFIRGMTAPRLLLARALRTDVGEEVFLRLEGARRGAQDVPLWSVLGPKDRAESAAQQFTRYTAMTDRVQRKFDGPITRDMPMVRFAAATVERLTRAGIKVLVIVAPYPWELAVPAHYDEARFARRVALLRQVVEENGGELLDLHRALPRSAFRDVDCHLTKEGAVQMATLVTPELRRVLTAADPLTFGALAH